MVYSISVCSWGTPWTWMRANCTWSLRTVTRNSPSLQSIGPPLIRVVSLPSTLSSSTRANTASSPKTSQSMEIPMFWLGLLLFGGSGSPFANPYAGESQLD